VGSEQGREVAVFDHYRAVLDAMAKKLQLEATNPELSRWAGGATLGQHWQRRRLSDVGSHRAVRGAGQDAVRRDGYLRAAQ